MAAGGATVTGLGRVGTWTPLQVIANSGSCDYGDIAVGPTGQVAVVFQSRNEQQPNSPSDVLMSVNPSGVGGTFASAWNCLTSNVGGYQSVTAAPSRGCDVNPGLAWDRTGGQYGGRLYMVYTDHPVAATNNLNIFVRYSTDAGAAWSPQVQVHATNTLSHFFPRIAVDQTSGKLAVSWYDCRADPGNTNTQFYATVSSDGGQTFSLNLQLETGHSDALATSPNLGYDYFDYTGLAYYGGYFYPAWADNSNNPSGNPDVTGEMDIFVAKVQY